MAGFGLRLARSQGMEGFTGSLNDFDIDPSNSDPIFTGDPVVLSGGYLVAATSTTGPILGVFMGCRYIDTNGDFKYRNQWDGNSGREDIRASVAQPAMGMFWIKGDAGVTFAQTTSVGAAHPFVFASGSVPYGDSRASLGAAGAGPVMVHRLVPLPNNAWGNNEPILEVSVNLQSAHFADAS